MKLLTVIFILVFHSPSLALLSKREKAQPLGGPEISVKTSKCYVKFEGASSTQIGIGELDYIHGCNTGNLIIKSIWSADGKTLLDAKDPVNDELLEKTKIYQIALRKSMHNKTPGNFLDLKQWIKLRAPVSKFTKVDAMTKKITIPIFLGRLVTLFYSRVKIVVMQHQTDKLLTIMNKDLIDFENYRQSLAAANSEKNTFVNASILPESPNAGSIILMLETIPSESKRNSIHLQTTSEEESTTTAVIIRKAIQGNTGIENPFQCPIFQYLYEIYAD